MALTLQELIESGEVRIKAIKLAPLAGVIRLGETVNSEIVTEIAIKLNWVQIQAGPKVRWYPADMIEWLTLFEEEEL